MKVKVSTSIPNGTAMLEKLERAEQLIQELKKIIGWELDNQLTVELECRAENEKATTGGNQ